MKNTFGADTAFIADYMKPIVLSDSKGAGKVAVLAELQGRVMTSTAAGDDGMSFGWINRDLFKSGEKLDHINPYGGEERFWMGPEGGQFAIFFKEGVPFDLDNWFTPPEIDTIPFDLLEKDQSKASFRQAMTLTNCSGTVLDIEVEREIRVLESDEIATKLGADLPENVETVCYESVNKLTNTGDTDWQKETGLLSIWILGMFNPSPETTVILPYISGSEADLGPVVNDAYFGKVPEDKLAVKDNAIYFKGDGTHRSKIGLTPQRAKPVLGSYDAGAGVLTVVQYTKPDGVVDYINSKNNFKYLKNEEEYHIRIATP